MLLYYSNYCVYVFHFVSIILVLCTGEGSQGSNPQTCSALPQWQMLKPTDLLSTSPMVDAQTHRPAQHFPNGRCSNPQTCSALPQWQMLKPTDLLSTSPMADAQTHRPAQHFPNGRCSNPQTCSALPQWQIS